MKYFKIETVNGFQYVKSNKAIRNRKQASQLFQESVIWVHSILLIKYIIKKGLTKC